MKKLIILVAVLTAMAWSQVRTITLDQNYTGKPANTTLQTDAYGNLMGAPLPVPTRAGQAFNGWYTAQTGGTKVLMGATGTKFTENATIYARWSALTPLTINDAPTAMKAHLDWIRYTRHDGQNGGKKENNLFHINSNGTSGAVNAANLIFDQIFHGQGTINYAIRWESDRVVTFLERQRIAAMLEESINRWTRPLIGFEDWPYHEIPVKVIGWAVANADYIPDPQPNEVIWINNDHREPHGIQHESFMASPPANLSRFINRYTTNYQYAGGLHARYDLLLWATKGFNGGAGGDWGQRQAETNVISSATSIVSVNSEGQITGINANGTAQIIEHEMGHGFGLYDFYGSAGEDFSPPINGATFGSGNLTTIMRAGNSSMVTEFDQWMIRYYYNWLRTASPESRFPMPSSSSNPSSSSSAVTVTVSCTLPNNLVTGTTLSTSTLRGYLTCSNTGNAPTTGTPTFTGTPSAPISGNQRTVAAAGSYTNITVTANCGTGATNAQGTCNNITIAAISSSSSVVAGSSSSSVVQSSSSEGSTPILNPQLSTLNLNQVQYYNLQGIPLGATKPTTPGLYIEKMGKNTRKIVVR